MMTEVSVAIAAARTRATIVIAATALNWQAIAIAGLYIETEREMDSPPDHHHHPKITHPRTA